MNDTDPEMNDTDPAVDAEITSLADGSLTGAERDELAARVEASPALRTQLREQERAVALMRATDQIVAPASLRAATNELTASAPAARSLRIAAPRWRPRLFVPLATGLAVAIAAVVIAVQGTPAPTVGQTAHLALAAATAPPPAEETVDPDLLTAHVGSVRFPSYEETAGWRATGARRDSLNGRTVITVFYDAPSGRRAGYSIVSGNMLADPDGPSLTTHGIRYTFARVGSARLITWRRGGHTCVIAGRSLSDRTLLALATADARA
jgi:anti-sigma factor RsiW